MIRDAMNPPGKSAHDKQANYDGSNRDVQRQFDRVVFYYDKKRGCQPYQPRDGSDFKGHWEKLQDKVDKYYYVKGMRPSGVPNAQVVSQGEAELAQPSTVRTTDRHALYQKP